MIDFLAGYLVQPDYGFPGFFYLLSGYLVIVLGAVILGREDFSWIGFSYLVCCLSLGLSHVIQGFILFLPDEAYLLLLARVWPVGFIVAPPIFYHVLTVYFGKFHERRLIVYGGWIVAALLVGLGLFTDFIVRDIQHFTWGNYPRYSLTTLFVILYQTAVMGLVFMELLKEFSKTPGNSRRKSVMLRILIGVSLASLMLVDSIPAFGFNVPPLGFTVALAVVVFFGHFVSNFSLDPTSPRLAADEIVSTMRDGVIVTDSEGSIRTVNRAVTALTGFDEKELRGRSMEWLANDALQLRELSGSEMTLQTNEQDPLPVSLSSSRLEDWNGALLGWVIVIRNIRDRREAERRLRESKERFRQLTENIDEVFWLYDRREEEYLYWSPAFEKVFGRAQSDTPDTVYEVEQMVSIDEDNSTYGSFENALESQGEFTMEYSIETSKGRRLIKDRGVPVRNEEGDPYRVAGLARDVTEIRRRNRVIREKNEELERFAHAASHDLQKPLRQLMTFCEFAREDLGAGNDESLRNHVEDIFESARIMEELVNALLRLARASRNPLAVEDVDLSELFQEVLEEFSTDLDRKSVTVELQEPLPVVRADETLLKEVARNLIDNSLKYSGNNLRVEILAEELDERTIVGIRDNGRGIARDEARRAFRPFERLHGEDEYEGTGMGLGICKKIVERHGGRIWLDSEWTDGTYVRFSLSHHPEEAHDNQNLESLPVLSGETG